MVKSLLDSEINYPEKKDLLSEHINKLSVVYPHIINDVHVEIAIGSAISYLDKPIVYFPVYLVYQNKFVSQIGLFELSEGDKYLDDEGDIDIELLNDILLYKFTTKEYLSKYKYSDDDDADYSDDDDDDDADYSDDDDDHDADYSDDDDEENWVNTFLGEKKIKIYDQPQDGHCFFSAIQMAFSKKYTIKQMRELLSDIVDPDQYGTYSTLYLANKEELKELKKEKKDVRDKLRDIEINYKKGLIPDKEKKTKLLEVKKYKSDLTRINKNISDEEEISNEYAFMKDIKSIKDLKEKIKTCGFWADSWAISKLEELLNVKVIILSSFHYDAKELHKVVQCPEKKDRESKPEYYIIVEHTGNHYKLVTFNKIKLFTFETIPESLKKHIVSTCMSGAPGSFHEIEEFRKYADSI